MKAVAFRHRMRVRRYWRSWALLALLSGIALSLSIAAVADARRADSALSRALEAGHSADLVVNANETSLGRENSDAYLAAVNQLPGVAETSLVGGVDLAEVNDDGTLATRLLFNSALGKLLDQSAVDALGTLRVLEGRMPDPSRADEVMVNREVVAATGWKVGEKITSLRLFRIEDFDEELSPDPSKGTPLELTIVGVARSPEELLNNEDQPQLFLFPAFGAAYPDATFYRNNYIRLTDGAAAIPEFRNAVTELAGEFENNQVLFGSLHDAYDRVQDALRPQILAVWLLVGVLFIAGLLLASQAIGRQIFAHNRDLSDLRALGMTPRELGLLGALHGWTIAISAAAVATILAFASSAFTPFGSTHSVEPDPGLRFDAAVLLLAFTIISVALAVTSFASARRLAGVAGRRGFAQASLAGGDRPSRAVGLLARSGLPPTVVTGSRFALQAGRGRTATPVRSVLASIALASAALVVAMSFSADLEHLVHTPRLYGWDWDAAVVNGFGAIPDDGIDEVREVPEIGALAGFTQGPLRIGDRQVAAVGIDQIDGTIFPTLEAGRVPQSESDIVLGRLTLQDIDKSIGDEIEVGTADGVKTMTIVGIATFPALGATTLSQTALGRGAATVASLFPPNDPNVEGRYNGVFIRLDPSLDRATALESLRTVFAEMGCSGDCFLTDSRPEQLSGYARLGALWVPFAVALGVLLAISLAHGIATTTKARRRDLAIFSALGWKRSQAGQVVIWQALTTTIISLVIALPLGIITANIGWRVFTEHFGIRPPIDVPVLELTLLALAAIVSAVAVGLVFVPSARRVRTFESLAGE
ncbi:MAG: ABC transporter permease [Acidimicrobiales bacterium]